MELRTRTWHAPAFTRRVRVPSAATHKTLPALDNATSLAAGSEAALWISGVSASVRIYLPKQRSVKSQTQPALGLVKWRRWCLPVT